METKMKKIHIIAALLAMLPTVLWANSYNYTISCNVSKTGTGSGTVYVSDNGQFTGSSDSSGSDVTKTFTITATPDPGSSFSGWTVTGGTITDSSAQSTTVSVKATKSASEPTASCVATFTKMTLPSFSVTFETSSAGTYTVDGAAPVNKTGLTEVTSVVLASSDPNFLNWNINGTVVNNNPYTASCTVNTTVSAEFLTADQVTSVTTLADLTAALSNAAYRKITIPSGAKIVVPSGTTLTIPSGKQLVVDGALDVVGTVSNSGAISGNGKLHKVSVCITQGDVIVLRNAAGGECAKYCETMVSQNNPSVTGNSIGCDESWAALLNGEAAYAITKQSPKAIRVTLNTTVAENKISGIAADSTSTPNGVDMIVADGNYVLIAETHLRGPIKEVKSSSSTYQRMGFIGTIDCAKNKLTSYCNQQGGNGAKVSFFNGTVVIDPTQSVDGDTSSSGSWGTDKYIQGFTYLKFYACTAITVKGLKNGNPMYFYGCGTSSSPATVTKSKYDNTGFSAGTSFFYCGYYTYSFNETQDAGTSVYGGSFKTTNPPQTIKPAKDANGNDVTLTAKEIGDYYVVQPDTGEGNVAKTGGQEYATLGEAIEHATSGGLVELIGNANLGGADLEIASTRNVTISLSKKTIENGKIINRGILVLTDSATPAGRNNSDESGGIVACDIENHNKLDMVFGLYAGAIVNKAGTNTIHNGLFTKALTKNGGEIYIKGGHFKDTAFTVASLSGFTATNEYKIFQANGYRSVCETPNGALTPETVSGMAGYTAKPYKDADFNLLKEWLTKKSKSDYSDANWTRLAELLPFYQVYNNYVIDSTLIFDRKVTAGSLSVKAGAGSVTSVDINEDIQAGKRFLPLTAVMAQWNSTAKTYNALIDENHPSVSVAIADGGTGVNNGTVCCIQPELGTSAYIFSKTFFTIGAGNNVAMIRPATGAATFYSTLAAAMNAAADGGTVMLANDCSTALPLTKAGTYTFDTMGFAYTGGAPSLGQGLVVKSATPVDSAVKALVPGAVATTYVVAPPSKGMMLIFRGPAAQNP